LVQNVNLNQPTITFVLNWGSRTKCEGKNVREISLKTKGGFFLQHLGRDIYISNIY